mmetsp:Transcript_54357/g.167287  ORF Transcript_54357/g.167287 Transcript_54357/m.167287 type:complete len:251 (-) Transcript_54357:2446-3198(-)
MIMENRKPAASGVWLNGASDDHERIASTTPTTPLGWRPKASIITGVASTRKTTSVAGHCAKAFCVHELLRHRHDAWRLQLQLSVSSSHSLTMQRGAGPAVDHVQRESCPQRICAVVGFALRLVHGAGPHAAGARVMFQRHSSVATHSVSVWRMPHALRWHVPDFHSHCAKPRHAAASVISRHGSWTHSLPVKMQPSSAAHAEGSLVEHGVGPQGVALRGFHSQPDSAMQASSLGFTRQGLSTHLPASPMR